MATYIAYRDGGMTNEIGLGRMTSKIWKGNVLDGLRIEASTPLAMAIDVTPGDIKINTGLTSFYGWSDDTETITVSTADPSNPRKDRVVAYVDLQVTPDTNQSNNVGLLKFAIIDGTASANPSTPNNTVVQNTIGTGNPWCDLGEITVNAGVTQINNGNIQSTGQPLGMGPEYRTGGFKLGIFPSSVINSVGTKHITGIGFKPKLVKLIMLYDGAGAYKPTGSMDDYGNQHYQTSTIRAIPGPNYAASNSLAGTDLCLLVQSVSLSGSVTTTLRIRHISMNDDGFTINILSTTGNHLSAIAYEAYA